jgi:glycosyltransferase involved in cell wall biosynthesis
VVAGEGRSRARCEELAGADVEFLGWVDRNTQRDLFRRCRALLYPGVEDFGILPVEAQACGAPVIALDAGGARDTVVPGVTGIRYPTAPEAAHALATAIDAFDPSHFDAVAIRAHAERFGAERFRTELAARVASATRRP